MKVVISFLNWFLRTPVLACLLSTVCRSMHKFARLSSLSGCCCWKQSPGIGWEALQDIFIPSWPCPGSPSLGRDDSSLLLSFRGCLSPPSLLPLSLSPRTSSVSFPSWRLLQPRLPAIRAEDVPWVCDMVSHHISPLRSPLCGSMCHLFSCCSFNINLRQQQQQQQQLQGHGSWTKILKSPELSQVSLPHVHYLCVLTLCFSRNVGICMESFTDLPVDAMAPTRLMSSSGAASSSSPPLSSRAY